MGSSTLYSVCAFAAIGGLCFGYDTGVISSVLTMKHFVTKMTGDPTLDKLSTLMTGTITGLLLAGCFIGSLLAGPSAEILSRKRTIIIGSLIFIIGGALQTGANGYAMMVVGRFVAGLGIGALSMIVPLYQSELAPKEIRGRLIGLQQLMITIGIMIAFWCGVGTEKRNGDSSWRIPLGVQVAPGVVLLIGAFFLPYSPRWLLSKGRNAEALTVLAQLHSDGDETAPHVVAEYEEILAQIELERAVAVGSYLELFQGKLRRRMILGMLIQVFQQFTGINSIMYYAPQIFVQAGLGSNSAGLIASGVNGCLNVLATIPAVLFMDRLGRRKIMISGAMAMGTAMILCGAVMGGVGEITTDLVTGDKTVNMTGNKSASYFCIVMIYLFVAGFAWSWGPVGWVYPAEIYPLSVRAKGTSITTASNWLMNFVISEICPVMLVKITYGTYIFFGCCCAIMATTVYFFYPETKGKSLEEMEDVFSGKVLCHKQVYTKSHSGPQEFAVPTEEEKKDFV
ncbi:general substrate transporter [Mucor mucedo]|uniref:general substrate transporter n=1 Tax=Mucor mucedo TaxID=29922 RepID=UPI00221FAA5A|nr:general substrate transporter [Mucor mucedo]KAI7889136.1 general substrate transporter [Mucor mucedo]